MSNNHKKAHKRAMRRFRRNNREQVEWLKPGEPQFGFGGLRFLTLIVLVYLLYASVHAHTGLTDVDMIKAASLVGTRFALLGCTYIYSKGNPVDGLLLDRCVALRSLTVFLLFLLSWFTLLQAVLSPWYSMEFGPPAADAALLSGRRQAGLLWLQFAIGSIGAMLGTIPATDYFLHSVAALRLRRRLVLFALLLSPLHALVSQI